MTQEKVKRIHQCYGWVLTALVAVVGVLFIAACLNIYTSGPRPYSAESIALGFKQICIPVYITLLGILGGIVLNLFLPLESKRPKSPMREDAVLTRLHQKVGHLEAEAQQTVDKECRLRRILRIAAAVIYAALMIYPTVYVLTPEHFTVSNLNGDIIKAVLIVMIPAVIGLIVCWLCQVLVKASMRREIQCCKQVLASRKKQPEKLSHDSKSVSSRTLWWIRGGILAAALILIVLGIFNGGVDDVLKKAIAICTECIGLG